METFDSILIGTMNILECLRLLKTPVRFYNAGSSECFGITPVPATEETPFDPAQSLVDGEVSSSLSRGELP